MSMAWSQIWLLSATIWSASSHKDRLIPTVIFVFLAILYAIGEYIANKK